MVSLDYGMRRLQKRLFQKSLKKQFFVKNSRCKHIGITRDIPLNNSKKKN